MKKAVTILLLVFAALDIGLPMLCRAEGGSAFDAAERSVALSSVVSISTISSISSNDAGQSPIQYEDDCFCCCSHIAPNHNFEPFVFFDSTPTELTSAVTPPETWVLTIPHPPRS